MMALLLAGSWTLEFYALRLLDQEMKRVFNVNQFVHGRDKRPDFLAIQDAKSALPALASFLLLLETDLLGNADHK